jgi:Zn-dependent M28 family amino/carboxypeptidase
MKRYFVLLICAGTVAAFAAAADKPDWDALGKRWWAHVQFLADDKLEGRDTGSEGFNKAAAYVAAEFERVGLRPAAISGFFQPVEFAARKIDEPNSQLEFLRGKNVQTIVFGEEAFFHPGPDAAESVEAEAVFAGYCLAVPEMHYDDFAGLDLRGKMAVCLSGGPAAIPGPLKAHYQSTGERWKALQEAGAIGYAIIRNPKSMDTPWSRAASSRFEPFMDLADPALQESRGLKIALAINPAHADKFLDGTGHSFAEILEAANADKALPHFPLGASFRARQSVKRWQVKSENLAGIFPGSDPKLKDEIVVLSAHLDHIGVGVPVNGDSIYNGAMDNASGVASLIEIARALHESSARPKRSILFLAVTGEEKGELGSQYFAVHPTVHGKNIVADINMDMYLPLFPLKYIEVQGLGESTLGDDIRAVAEKAGVQVQADKQPERNRFIRSDQYSFIKRGVPALAFKFGWLPGTPQEKIFNDWLTTRYHAPSDDAGQPVDAEAAAEFNAILEQLAERVANAPERPHWNADSFFRRFVQ